MRWALEHEGGLERSRGVAPRSVLADSGLPDGDLGESRRRCAAWSSVYRPGRRRWHFIRHCSSRSWGHRRQCRSARLVLDSICHGHAVAWRGRKTSSFTPTTVVTVMCRCTCFSGGRAPAGELPACAEEAGGRPSASYGPLGRGGDPVVAGEGTADGGTGRRWRSCFARRATVAFADSR